jgi:hypothetical protein
MSASELIAHLYKRRDQRPRGSAGWHDLDRVMLLLNRVWGGAKATEAEIRHAVGLVKMHAPELAEDVRAGCVVASAEICTEAGCRPLDVYEEDGVVGWECGDQIGEVRIEMERSR